MKYLFQSVASWAHRLREHGAGSAVGAHKVLHTYTTFAFLKRCPHHALGIPLPKQVCQHVLRFHRELKYARWIQRCETHSTTPTLGFGQVTIWATRTSLGSSFFFVASSHGKPRDCPRPSGHLPFSLAISNQQHSEGTHQNLNLLGEISLPYTSGRVRPTLPTGTIGTVSPPGFQVAILMGVQTTAETHNPAKETITNPTRTNVAVGCDFVLASVVAAADGAAPKPTNTKRSKRPASCLLSSPSSFEIALAACLLTCKKFVYWARRLLPRPSQGQRGAAE